MEVLNLRQIAKVFFRRCHAHKIKCEIHEFDNYRKKYDSLSFSDKKRITRRWSKKYPEQAHFRYDYVDLWLQKYVKTPVRILEIGGWKGDLASKVLLSSMNIELWHNYDLIESDSTEICKDKRYNLFSLDYYVWNKSIGRD